MSNKDLDDCRQIMQSVINEMSHRSLFFNGVLNGGFFLTKDGIRFMEFNGRFGDPEGLNILSIFDGSFAGLICILWHKSLAEDRVQFVEQASVIKYLVAHEYPAPSPQTQDFTVDTDAIKKAGCKVFFASAEKRNNEHSYCTLKTSRVVAIGAVANSITDASDRVNAAIDAHVTGNLEFRRDIGSQGYIDSLKV